MAGGTLKDVVKASMDGGPSKRAYRLRDAVRWLLDIACGLRYLHSRIPMVLHRDLKLDNIMLSGACCIETGSSTTSCCPVHAETLHLRLV